MSSELQLDVRHLSRWRRHLVNAYEVKAGMVFIAGKTVWSMPERFKVVCLPCKALYKCSALTSLARINIVHQSRRKPPSPPLPPEQGGEHGVKGPHHVVKRAPWVVNELKGLKCLCKRCVMKRSSVNWGENFYRSEGGSFRVAPALSCALPGRPTWLEDLMYYCGPFSHLSPWHVISQLAERTSAKSISQGHRLGQRF